MFKLIDRHTDKQSYGLRDGQTYEPTDWQRDEAEIHLASNAGQEYVYSSSLPQRENSIFYWSKGASR